MEWQHSENDHFLPVFPDLCSKIPLFLRYFNFDTSAHGFEPEIVTPQPVFNIGKLQNPGRSCRNWFMTTFILQICFNFAISAFDKIFFGNLAAVMLEWLLVRLDTQKLRKLDVHNAYLSLCVLLLQSKLDIYDSFYTLDVLILCHFCLW